MINSLFQKYQNLINNPSESAIQFREQISEALWIEGRITALSGNLIMPSLPVEQTKFSLTRFDVSGARRVNGIDNHEHKPLHQHSSNGELAISGEHTLASIGSYAFSNFFK